MKALKTTYDPINSFFKISASNFDFTGTQKAIHLTNCKISFGIVYPICKKD